MITLDKMREDLNALTVSVAALNANHKALAHKLEAIDTVQDAIRFEAERDRKAILEAQGTLAAALVTHDKAQDIQHLEHHQKAIALDAKLSATGDGLAGEIQEVRDKLRLELAASIGNAFLNFERKVKRQPRKRQRSKK